jgi:hypothetical protein
MARPLGSNRHCWTVPPFIRYRMKGNSRTIPPYCVSFLRRSLKYCTTVLRRFVSEIHVTVKWGNMSQRCCLSRRYTEGVVSCTQDTAHSRAQLWSNGHVIHTRLTATRPWPRCLWQSAGIATWEYALGHLGRRHPDDNVFLRLEQRLCEAGSVQHTALVNAGQSTRTPGN